MTQSEAETDTQIVHQIEEKKGRSETAYNHRKVLGGIVQSWLGRAVTKTSSLSVWSFQPERSRIGGF